LLDFEETYTWMEQDEDGNEYEVTETYGNDGSIRIETEGDMAWLVIEITHDAFKNEGMVLFET
jgi:hypothetical protein